MTSVWQQLFLSLVFLMQSSCRFVRMLLWTSSTILWLASSSGHHRNPYLVEHWPDTVSIFGISFLDQGAVVLQQASNFPWPSHLSWKVSTNYSVRFSVLYYNLHIMNFISSLSSDVLSLKSWLYSPINTILYNGNWDYLARLLGD